MRVIILALAALVCAARAAYAEPPPPLEAYGRFENVSSLSLSPSGKRAAFLITTPKRRLIGVQEVGGKLLATVARDVEDLLPQLQPRAEELARLAIEKLRGRGEREAKELREILERQRERVQEQLAKRESDFLQYTLDFVDREKRELEVHMRSWRDRLKQFAQDLESEPQRIRDFYQVKARRIEPVGLVYLWPETN